MIEKINLKNQVKVLHINRKPIKYHKQESRNNIILKTTKEIGEQEETEVLNTVKREPILLLHGLHQEVG